MSEVLHLECARAKGLLAEFVDGDLGPEESIWLRRHVETCAECGAALAAFSELDCELTGWGQTLGLRNPPPAGARERLAASMGEVAAKRRIIRWLPAAAALAAAIALAVAMPHRKPAADISEERPFVEIPYLAPLDPHESATIMRIHIRVATLIAVGYRVAADPDEVVAADVLVGEDGRAHAMRVAADVGLSGIGD